MADEELLDDQPSDEETSSAPSSASINSSQIEIESTQTSLKFQVFSDLHLEERFEYASFTPPVLAPFLILAGDIGAPIRPANDMRNGKMQGAHADAYVEFIKRMCGLYRRVFLVPGNGEAKGAVDASFGQRGDGEDGMRAMKEFFGNLTAALDRDVEYAGNFHVLDRQRFDFDDDPLHGENARCSILGCTLWSRLSSERGQDNANQTDMGIFSGIRGHSRDRHMQYFNRDLQWLRNEIANVRSQSDGYERRIIVVTHHAPAVGGTADPRYDGQGSRWSGSQTRILGRGGSGLEDGSLIAGDVWVFGHTTWSTPNLTVDGVRVYSNQRGGFMREMTQRYTLRLERALRKEHVWRPEFWRAARVLRVECPVVELGDHALEDDMWNAEEETDGDE